MNRALDVNLHDAHIGIWQDDARDPTFRAEIYLGCLRLFQRRGWRITADPKILKHYRCLSKDRRLAEKGDLRASIDISGRVVEIEVWAETWPMDNQNGRRHDFNKRERMAFLDRVRLDLETSKIIAWLGPRATVTVKARGRKVGADVGDLTAMDMIAADYAQSWHADKDLGRPVCTQAYNAKSADKGVVEHGATVWFADRKGRICRGTAFYNINNMWWVAANQHSLTNLACHELYVQPPQDLRRKRNDRARRDRLEALLARAIRACDFQRADLLKRIAFGAEATYGIWSRKNDAYYRPNRAGYTGDALSAGRYTWDEAKAEVLRVPHYLSLVMPDGGHLTADQLKMQAAA